MSWEQRYPVDRLVPYDPVWVERYQDLLRPLVAALGPAWAFEHVGSTSVPGLSAKPVIDLALAPPPGGQLVDHLPALRDVGWSEPVAVGDHQAIFVLDGTVRVAIGHVFTREQWPSAHVRLFAQWLRGHDADRDEYARLKAKLVADGFWGSDYTERKAEFVRRVVDQARASRGWARAPSF
jgi:GrpB-like predicted nucleotidyltransferase (UPF0157 family)